MNGVIYINKRYALPLTYGYDINDLENDMNRGDKIFKEANSNIIYLIEDFDSTAYSFMKEEN
ncbi:MAG: hypothetical protein R3E32_27265 [Chitinophagales bacterium]